jgi:hypothetical protein
LGVYVPRLNDGVQNNKVVKRGLDPRIHPSSQESFEGMDCRVKPGNDDLLGPIMH